MYGFLGEGPYDERVGKLDDQGLHGQHNKGGMLPEAAPILKVWSAHATGTFSTRFNCISAYQWVFRVVTRLRMKGDAVLCCF